MIMGTLPSFRVKLSRSVQFNGPCLILWGAVSGNRIKAGLPNLPWLVGNRATETNGVNMVHRDHPSI